jgi:hypothetical protein
MEDTRVTAAGILVLGFVASAFAVVPGFDRLVHGNKVYLVTTALLGVGALAAGVAVMLSSEGLALTGVIAATVVLWAISTTHHVLLARVPQAPPRAEAREGERAHSH